MELLSPASLWVVVVVGRVNHNAKKITTTMLIVIIFMTVFFCNFLMDEQAAPLKHIDEKLRHNPNEESGGREGGKEGKQRHLA